MQPQPGTSSLLQQELAFVVLLTLAALVAFVLRRIRARLPYTVALVVVGLALSFLPSPQEFNLSSEIILWLLVPPLIFEATLNLSWGRLRQDLGLVLLLALAGTLLGAAIVSGIILLFSRTLVPELQIPFTAVFAFGALISATDPVAVIALFRNLGVSKRLTILIEGESLFNDGIAITLFNIALASGAMAAGQSAAEPGIMRLGEVVFEFLTVAVGGLAIGSVLGLIVSYVFLRNVDDHLIETAITVALAFGSFVLAEQFHVSGILAVVAAGLFVGNLGTQNTSPTTRYALQNFWEFMAFVVNSLVFLLIGLDTDLIQFPPNLRAILVAVLAVLVSRAVVVFGLTWLHGLVDARRRLPFSYRLVAYWGGLRGAISLALALILVTSGFSTAVTQELRMMTFGVVLFTLLIQGTTIAPLLRLLGLAERPEQELMQQRQQALLYAARAGKRELDRLLLDGILTEEVWQAMSEVYEGLLTRRNRELRDLFHDYSELEQAVILQVRRDLLRAERSALNDAAVRGLISERVHHQLMTEMNNQLAALNIIRDSLDLGALGPENE